MAGKRRRFGVIELSSDEEDSIPQTMSVNAVVHRNESNVFETEQFLEESSAEGALSISAKSVAELIDISDITTVPQGDRGINSNLLDYIADKSKYSQYKSKRQERSEFENISNIISTVEKVYDKINRNQQERF